MSFLEENKCLKTIVDINFVFFQTHIVCNLLIYSVIFQEVRLKGLEPPRLSAPDPKSGVATNYTTAAKATAKIRLFFKLTNYFLE